MSYIPRHIEQVIQRAAGLFPVVMLTGARQVGKTTVLRSVYPDTPYLSLDDPVMLTIAREQPKSFLSSFTSPLILDEVQYAPELFPVLKLTVDEAKKSGQYLLSGSQQFHLMKNVSETLPGRIAVLTLLGLSLREMRRSGNTSPFLPSDAYFSSLGQLKSDLSASEVWSVIHRGSMPAMHANPEMDWEVFYSSYVRTYIERDLRDLTQVGDEDKFLKFMTVLAAQTGQLLNLASVARDVGVTQPTAGRWLSVLQTSNQVILLPPYFNNLTKRAVKTPKLYFTDTGLAAYLTRWTTPDVMQYGAMAGAFFETFVISEVYKSYVNAGIQQPPLYYYRNKDKREIDLIIEADGILHPIEIKSSADPTTEDITALGLIESIPKVKRGKGGVICLSERLLQYNPNDRIIPLGLV